MKSAEIRDKFLKYFESKGHTIVRASSLVPANDPTLLFVNSGMVQFKDVFTGREKRAYTRAVTAQKSLRAGGKHNDLENVGYTARHHTFFEMLGNFSFGDYFKRDAIKYAWQLLTQVYQLPADRLWTTVYVDDDEAYDIWTREIGVPAARCIRIGDKPGQPKYVSDNFWQMADTGPCGPCSEIFYDHGPEVAGGPPGSPDADGDRYIEIWNLVFMQFDRDDEGVLTPLPKPCVDTGMGLERLAAVLQHVHSNYEIDLFRNLIAAAARETHTKDLASNSLKVIADHIRACSFLIADGVIPGNEGRGYVLRRIIRRALRHGYKLGCRQPFFHKVVRDLVAEMGAAYPELCEQRARIEGVLKQEEERFGETLENGMKILDGALGALKSGDARMLDGETVFLLYDTYGFPVDLTADICRERGISVDHAGFERAMERQREQARAAGKFRSAAGVEYSGGRTRFVGYEHLTAEAKVVGLYVDGTPVSEVRAGQSAIIVLDATPFYAESGGQVGDRGELIGSGGTFEVVDTQKIMPDVFGHHGRVLSGSIEFGEKVTARVNVSLRTRTMHNHSATHLMHAALRKVLGNHVQQKGSLVDAERTRFDFAHDKPMSADEIRQVEDIVNAAIRANAPVTATHMKYDDAIRAGALAFFGDKYGDEVRVLAMGEHSTELCGGTHVARTGDIGFFKIVAEGGVAAGVRRVEAVTGAGALAYVQALDAQLAEVAAALKSPAAEITAKLAHLQDHVKALEKELARLKGRLAASQGDDLAARAIDIKGIKVLAATLEGADAKVLRDTVDQLKNKLKSAAIVLASVDGKEGEQRVQLAAGVTADVTSRLKAGDLVNHVAQQIGGRGGGRPDMAMAGGTDAARLPAALASVKSWAEQRL
jgi:alanyl-tRNA synthetase